MNLKSILAVSLIASGATASATVLLSKQTANPQSQSTIATIQKIEATTSSMMIMQRPI